MSEQTLTKSIARDVWVEQYRPDTFDDVVGQDIIIDQLRNHVKNEEVPNLLFAGPSGVGKTATAMVIAKELYGDTWREYFLELNASDQRGIDVVRDRIKDYADTSLASNFQRIIFLDESDALTSDAQSALRRTMEKFHQQIIFILSCNYPREIIPAIQSRCARLQFSPINDDIVKQRLTYISEQEDVNVTEGGLDGIIQIADGDMRMAIQTLQTVSVYEDKITKDIVLDLMSYVRPEEIEEMILHAGSGDFRKSRKMLLDLMNNRGVDSGTILDVMHEVIWDLDINDKLMVRMANHIGETDYRIMQGANEDIQMQALLSEFTLMG